MAQQPTVEEGAFISSQLTEKSSKIPGNGMYAIILKTNWCIINKAIIKKGSPQQIGRQRTADKLFFIVSNITEF